MNHPALQQISVITTPEAEDAVAALMERIFGLGASAYTDEETKISRVSVYCPASRAGSNEKRAALAAGLRAIKSSGLKLGSGKIETRRVAKQDWSESWKRHFKAFEVGKSLLVKPSWIKRKPAKGQQVVVLDPGLSFGTGNHPTTAFCLRQLAALRRPERSQSFWDVGTGSGILAIAAAKLGYRPVFAIDNDPESVRVAKANAEQNRVSKLMRIQRREVAAGGGARGARFDVICANLTSNLLVEFSRMICARLKAGGALVLAGIRAEEFESVARAYKKCGLKLLRVRREEGWASGTFQLM